MTCEEFLPLLSGHLDQMNTPEEDAALQAHLKDCPACQKLLAQWQENDRVLETMKETAPPELQADVMAKIKGEKRRTVRYRRFAAMAAALAVIIGAAALLPNWQSEQPQVVAEGQTYAVARSMHTEDVDAVAKQVAETYGAPVVLIYELYYEIETYPCTTLEEGYVLYALPDHDAALLLSETYGCVIYSPDEVAEGSAAYALLAV